MGPARAASPKTRTSLWPGIFVLKGLSPHTGIGPILNKKGCSARRPNPLDETLGEPGYAPDPVAPSFTAFLPSLYSRRQRKGWGEGSHRRQQRRRGRRRLGLERGSSDGDGVSRVRRHLSLASARRRDEASGWLAAGTSSSGGAATGARAATQLSTAMASGGGTAAEPSRSLVMASGHGSAPQATAQ